MDRRRLSFDNFNDAVTECERLLSQGYTKSGNWTLGQMCSHLRITIDKNIHGYPRWMVIFGYPLRPILRRFMLPRLLAGDSPTGIRTAGMFVPPENLDDAKEFDAFKDCVTEFAATKTPLHPHPGFGQMTHAQFESFHAAHAAHHLGFLHPHQPA